MTASADPCVNSLSIDVEDWIQSVHDPDADLTDRFVRSTHRILELLERHETRATFFVLGLAARKAPGLVREIHDGGHEVQSHGYAHRPIHHQTRRAFRRDVERSKNQLEDLIGTAVTGYRAPAFSITRHTLWALDVLVESGFRYDSSIFPLRMRRYGIAGTPWHMHRLRTIGGAELIEVPVASAPMGAGRYPVAGGGYFRLLPYGIIRHGLRRLNRRKPATVYLHPYEFDPTEMRQLRGHSIPWHRRLSQGLGRRTIPGKLERLLRDFRWCTISTMIESQPAPCPRIRGQSPVSPLQGRTTPSQ